MRTIVEETYDKTGIYVSEVGLAVDRDKATWITNYRPQNDADSPGPTREVQFLSKHHESKSRRPSSMSFQQNGGRRGKPKVSRTEKVTWSRKKGSKKWIPSCRSGFRLQRIGKKLMCVKN